MLDSTRSAGTGPAEPPATAAAAQIELPGRGLTLHPRTRKDPKCHAEHISANLQRLLSHQLLSTDLVVGPFFFTCAPLLVLDGNVLG